LVDVQVYELLTNDAYYIKTETYSQAEVNTQISNALTIYDDQTASDARYVNITGDTMTGNLDITGTVTADGLTVDGDATLQTSGGTILTLGSTDTGVIAGDVYGSIHFDTADTSNAGTAGRIEVTASGSSAHGIMDFYTTFSGTQYNRLKINYDGDISFYEDTGTTAKLIWDASAETLALGLSTANARLEVGAFATTNSDIAYFSNSNGAQKGIIRLDAQGDGEFVLLDAGNNEDVVITAGGDSYFNGGNVGIGTSDPDALLHLRKIGNSYPTLRFERDDTEIIAGNNIGRIEFEQQDTDAPGVSARIEAVSEGTAGAVAIAFETGTPTSITERMRIDSSGNTTFKANNSAVGPVVTLENTATAVNGQAWGSIHFDSNDLSTSASGTRASIVGTSTSFNGDGNLDFYTAPANGTNTFAMRIDSSGNVLIKTSSHTPTQTELVVASEYSASGTTDGGITLSARSGGNWYNSGIFANGSALTFTTGDTGLNGALVASEKMRIDSSGNLTLSTSKNDKNILLIQNDDTTTTDYNTQSYLKLSVGGDIVGGLKTTQKNLTGLSTKALYLTTEGNYPIAFGLNASPTPSMVLDTSGNFLVGNPTPAERFVVNGQGAFGSEDASGNGIYLYVSGALADNSYMSRSSAGTGTTTWYIGNQSITTSSDVRLKDNIVDSERNAVEIINNLRVVDHTWNDPSDQSVNNKNSRGVWTGLIAQEAVEHIPWLVNRPLEDVDENGNKNYWHMDYGYSVPLLIKAIQEQQEQIEQLKAEVAALKGAN